MIKEAILTILFLHAAILPAFSREPVKKKPSVVIYNFHAETNLKKFRFYSKIIPITLKKSLNIDSKYNIEYIPRKGMIAPKDIKKRDPEYKNYIKRLSEISKKHSADYIVSGSYKIDNKMLMIDVQIFNTRNKELVNISKSSRETGVLLKEAIDHLTTDMKESLAPIIVAKTSSPVEKSPFLTLYRGINFITFGLDFGNVYLLKQWGNNYNNTQFVDSYLLFNFSRYTGLSLDAEYFSTDNEDKFTGNFQLKMWAFSMNIHLSLPLSEYMSLSIAGGGGVARSRIDELPPNDPVDGVSIPDPLNTERSNNRYIRAALSLIFEINPLIIKFGSSYKSVFFDNSTLRMYNIFAGIGYRI